MKVKYCNRAGEVVTRTIQPGNKLVGLRLIEFTIESYDEQQQLLSSRGLDWFRQNVHFTKGSISDGKESNWGSDWVDDGV